jgi:hypothetical protein
VVKSKLSLGGSLGPTPKGWLNTMEVVEMSLMEMQKYLGEFKLLTEGFEFYVTSRNVRTAWGNIQCEVHPTAASGVVTDVKWVSADRLTAV